MGRTLRFRSPEQDIRRADHSSAPDFRLCQARQAAMLQGAVGPVEHDNTCDSGDDHEHDFYRTGCAARHGRAILGQKTGHHLGALVDRLHDLARRAGSNRRAFSDEQSGAQGYWAHPLRDHQRRVEAEQQAGAELATTLPRRDRGMASRAARGHSNPRNLLVKPVSPRSDARVPSSTVRPFSIT